MRLLLGLVALALAGCKPADPGELPVKAPVREPKVDFPLFIDPETGCQYLGSVYRGLTPRLGRDGRQICFTLQSPVKERPGT